MLFHSFAFGTLLVATLLLYWAAPWQKARLGILVVASFVFYGYRQRPAAMVLLLVSIAVNYLAGLLQERRRSRRLLTAIIVFNVSLLLWFKYAAFATSEIRRVASFAGIHVPLPTPWTWLPLGISFFTFQVIAYQVDVYQSVIPAERSLLAFAAFKSFFAKLIAGPLVRPREFLPGLHTRARFDAVRFHHGVFLFLAGLALKLGVADVLRQFADEGFSHAGQLATTDAWLDLYAYAFQMFADFWGYSTMARGIGELFALEIPINFDLPFSTRSIQEFWQHWHMTLTAFITTYLYTPFARAWRPFTLTKSMLTTVLVMTIAGLWHDAGWTFILWGFLHGVWLALEAAYRRFKTRRARGKVRSKSGDGWAIRTIQGLLVFHGVCLLWVLFRAPSLKVAASYWRNLLLPPYGIHSDVPETLVIFLIGFALFQGPISRAIDRERFLARPVWAQVAQTWALLAVMLGYAQQQYDFIYFAF